MGKTKFSIEDFKKQQLEEPQTIQIRGGDGDQGEVPPTNIVTDDVFDG